jgi:hypothetical protein
MFKNNSEYYDAIYSDTYNKPIVHYSRLFSTLVVGQFASVVTADHPDAYLNDAPYVWTSAVLKVNEETGEFETRNTMYVPVKVEA